MAQYPSPLHRNTILTKFNYHLSIMHPLSVVYNIPIEIGLMASLNAFKKEA